MSRVMIPAVVVMGELRRERGYMAGRAASANRRADETTDRALAAYLRGTADTLTDAGRILDQIISVADHSITEVDQ